MTETETKQAGTAEVREPISLRVATHANVEIKRIAARDRSWASQQSKELHVSIVDYYMADVLDDIETAILDAMPEDATPADKNTFRAVFRDHAPDVEDALAHYFQRTSNMNLMNNRLASAGLIDRVEGGRKKVGGEFV